MKCQVLRQFVRRGVSQLPGSVIDVPEEMLLKMAGYVQKIMPPSHCQARKVGGRICGRPLRDGVNGFLTCTDPGCQVPATPHGLVRRGGKAK
ncbi:MAG: hypothetical protein PHN84_15380 [Desulfuromonadaceae bacterium]|nr:hypothetical protein [Desulfuromonadaceae bacterium]MDD2857024.1 hypothetical protein [Desulfuromonadaceae bacterium]